jgi:hypothetical protein
MSDGPSGSRSARTNHWGLSRERQQPPFCGSTELSGQFSAASTRKGGGTSLRAEGTLREHKPGHARPRAVTPFRQNSSDCGIFVVAMTRGCPCFPLQTSMVRRGSTVRVRQRALQKPRSRGFSVRIDLHKAEYASGAEPFMELPGSRPSLLTGSGRRSRVGASLPSGRLGWRLLGLPHFMARRLREQVVKQIASRCAEPARSVVDYQVDKPRSAVGELVSQRREC